MRLSEVHRGLFIKPVDITKLVDITSPELGEHCIDCARLHKRLRKRDLGLFHNLQEFCGSSGPGEITPVRGRGASGKRRAPLWRSETDIV